MIIKRAACLAFTAACLTGIATLPAANAQTAYGTDPGGNSVGVPGPNPGGPGLTPYSGGGYGYGYTTGTYVPQPQNYAPPPAAGTSDTEMVTNGPQGSSPPNWSAEQNVRESARYDRMLEGNRGFREARMRKECGPITDPQLHQQCIESFAQDEPYGSSSSSTHYRSSSGR